MKPKIMIGKLSKLVDSLFRRISGTYSYVNNDYFKETYFREVKEDLEILKRSMNFCKYERDKELVFQYLFNKYQKNYCPSTFYKYFSFDNQLKYLYLRGEIDNIIAKKDDFFSDFLNTDDVKS